MAVRSGMTDILTRVQYLIGDTGTAQFTLQHVQDKCDEHVTIIRYEPLEAIEDILPGGTVAYKEFWAIAPNGFTVGHWEGTAGTALIFLDSAFGTITGSVVAASSSDMEGRWRFGYEPTRPVYVTGRNYDIEAVAADLCEEWIAALKKCVTFSDGNQKIDLNAQISNLELLIDKYRARQSPYTACIQRGDLNGNRISYFGDDPRRYTTRHPVEY